MPDNDEKLLGAPEKHSLLDEPAEEKLRKEMDELRRQLDDLRNRDKKKHNDSPPRPRKRTLWIIGAVMLGILFAAFVLGWLPHHNREKKLQQEAQAEAHALPVVNYILAQNSPATEELMLPGTTEALIDAPLLARSTGYITRRLVDIGDHVRKGQLLAVIAAPDLDQQVLQARAQLLQSRAALKQASANLVQGRANEALAHVTAARYENLVRRGAIARQENDTQQANYQAQVANLEALNQAVSAANQNVASAEANLQRLLELQSFNRVTAPFDGIVTLRNTDVGALINNGSTLLFRIAQIGRLRTYISVPQPNAPSIRVGQTAQLLSPEFGARQVFGRVTRTAEALDPATRTLMTEVQVENPRGELRPGMFVQVNLKNPRTNPPILVPGDAVIAGPDGTQVAVIRDARPIQVEPKPQQTDQKGKDHKDQQKSQQESQKPQQGVEGTVHLQSVQIGRDYGAATEILSGLSPRERVIINPNDVVRENARVRGILTKANLDVVNGAPGKPQPNVNNERLQPVPSGETPQRQPSKMNKSRGPGH